MCKIDTLRIGVAFTRANIFNTKCVSLNIMTDFEVIELLREHRRKLSRLPAGSIVRFKSSHPEDLGKSNIGIVQRDAALSAVVVLYIDAEGQPQQAVAAASDLSIVESERDEPLDQDNTARDTRNDLQPGINKLTSQIKSAAISDTDKATLALRAGKAILSNIADEILVSQFTETLETEDATTN